MDKPLSQERPKPDYPLKAEQVERIAKAYRHHIDIADLLGHIVAVEAERDRYKKTVEQILKTQELETFEDSTLLDLIYRIAKGAERNE